MNSELYAHEDAICDMISEGYTYQQICDFFTELTGEPLGLSSRSVRRFWSIGPGSGSLDDASYTELCFQQLLEWEENDAWPIGFAGNPM